MLCTMHTNLAPSQIVNSCDYHVLKRRLKILSIKKSTDGQYIINIHKILYVNIDMCCIVGLFKIILSRTTDKPQ